ncbi:MAG: hypothetical protein HGB11_08220 [Chlorobiales bacterium]|nr:hypothetical protein [Chlorobiales bacterium]
MRYILSILVVFAFIASGCGSSKQSMQGADAGDIPGWYMNPPQDKNYLYATNTQTSQDMQLAVDKATTGARSEIGRQVEVRLKSLQKKFTEETGKGDDAQLLQMFSQAEKVVVSTALSGTRIKQNKQVKDGKMYRSYVLVEYPIGEASQQFLEQLKKNEQMYTRFREAKAMQDLEDEVDKYEQFKKGQ